MLKIKYVLIIALLLSSYTADRKILMNTENVTTILEYLQINKFIPSKKRIDLYIDISVDNRLNKKIKHKGVKYIIHKQYSNCRTSDIYIRSIKYIEEDGLFEIFLCTNTYSTNYIILQAQLEGGILKIINHRKTSEIQ